jgi:hypothetical protein
MLSEELKNNFEIVEAAAKSKNIVMGLLPIELKNNFEIALTAVK